MSVTALWIVGSLAAVLGLLSAVMSALLDRSGLIRLRHWVEEAGGPLAKLYQRKGRFEIYRLSLSLISRMSVVVVFAVALALGWPAWLAFVMSTVMVLVAELTSRSIAARHAEAGLRSLSKVYRFAMVVLAPFITVLRPVFPYKAMDRDDSIEIDEASEGEIDAYISVGQREGILEPGEEILLKGLVEFGDTLVKSVMTPRIDMIAAPIASSPESLLELFLQSGHSRLPLLGDSADQVLGVLHLRDLVSAMRNAETFDPEPIARPAYIVPETKPIADLLREFQARHQQLAVAVDEFGGTAGIVTVEDLLEEIVGDIADEHEDHDLDRVRLGESVWLLAGSFHVEELEELFDVDLGADPPYETIGGLVFTTLGSLPQRGDTVRQHGLEFEVLEVRNRRIRKVRVRPLEVEG